MTDQPSFPDAAKAVAAARRAKETAIAPPPRPRRAVNGNAVDKWLESTFRNVIEDVRNTPIGERNARLRWAARRLGEISHGGLDETTCRNELERAAQDNGVWREDGANACRASIESGWRKGVSDPEDLSGIGKLGGTRIPASTPARAPIPGAVNGAGSAGGAGKGGAPPPPGAEGKTLRLRKLSTIKSRVPQWVWEYEGIGRIQLGTLTMFAGKPGAGKSTAARWFAAKLSTGELPGVWFGNPMRVAVVMAEEQTDAVVVPGLRAAGADLDNVYTPEIKIRDMELSLTVDDIYQLREELLDNQIRVLIIDPILSMFSGKADIYRNNEVRTALDPFRKLASDINGIIMGITHLKKGEVRDVLGGMNGSGAFGELPRAVFGFAPMDNGDYVMEQVKNSAGPIGLKLGYRLPVSQLTADDGQPLALPTFDLGGQTEIGITDIDADAETVVGVAQAAQWLYDYLMLEQPSPSATVKAVARDQADINERMLQRAAKRLGVVVRSFSTPEKPHRTAWLLPPEIQ
jgi:hypothetical protein